MGLPNYSPIPTPAGGPGEPAADTEELSPLDEHLQSSLENEGKKDESDPVCEKVSPAIAMWLEKWFRKIHCGSEVQEILKLCERLENCDALKVVQVNLKLKK